MSKAYVHGNDDLEHIRLQDQASTVVDLLSSETMYPSGSTVLEAGGGVGAKTHSSSINSPVALINSIHFQENTVKEDQR